MTESRLTADLVEVLSALPPAQRQLTADLVEVLSVATFDQPFIGWGVPV